MEKGGPKYTLPYEQRLDLVRKYVHTKTKALDLAAVAGVSEPTFRRWIRELRQEAVKADQPKNGHDEQRSLPLKETD